MFLLLHSSSVVDAVALSLLRIASKREDLATVSIEDFIKEASLNQREDGGHELTSDPHLSNLIQGAPVLINRAFLGQQTLRAKGDNGVSDLTLQTEIESTLRETIGLNLNSTADPGQYSLCGHYLPLYLQWSQVLDACPWLRVPRYTYSFGSVPPDVSDFSRIVYKSPYDFRSWKPNKPPDFWWHTFAVDRPAGVPVVATVIGGDSVVQGADIGEDVRSIVRDSAQAICRTFGSTFGEILYFADESEVTFAAFSHPVASDIDPAVIDQMLESWLDDRSVAVAT